MKLSVVIVNYNVKAFLEQCLRSVFQALGDMEGEVFVVDNQSTDGSVEMVRREFPSVKVVANRVNVGFSRANNQAIRMCQGDYVLLLNPDTVVGEDVFRKVVAFLDANPKAGGLGVKMIDGTGRFLPESKRGLPTPTVAFFKIMGLSRIFPHSKLFGRYHLGHLPENETAPIEILSGACMFLRRSVLDEVGLLDESFFMYGEDIDLSYRIRLGGYENWYLPEARIIHYKGESTKKSSVNYVFVFYNAMVIFARKHFTRRGPQLFSIIIRGAIYLSAAAAIVARFLRTALIPLLDAALLSAALLLMPRLGLGPVPGLAASAVLVIGVLLLLAVTGAYDAPARPGRSGIGMLIVLAVLWALGPWLGPWSGPVMWGLPLAALAMMIMRVIAERAGVKRPSAMGEGRVRILAVGSPAEARQALALLWQTHYGLGRTLALEPGQADPVDGASVIRDLIGKERLHQVVFCAKDLQMQQIIQFMEELRSTKVIFKIAQPSSTFIIGPGATESLQDLLVLRDHGVNSPASMRRRKLLDVLLSIFLLLTVPFTIWWIRDKAGFFRNLSGVLAGRYTWMGYASTERDRRIPRLKPGVLNPVVAAGLSPLTTTVRRVDLEYAKDYRAWRDLRYLLSNLGMLGTSPVA